MEFNQSKPLRVFEAFAGYGSQSMALNRLKEDFSGFDFMVVGISEIDKSAIKAYAAVHGSEIPNFGDISKIVWEQVPDFDLLTYSFPCQDISTAGLQRGFAEGAGTRSSLLWECAKAISTKRPKYLLMENVKALIQKKFMPEFNRWIEWLSSQGYNSFYQVLNAKNYGIPQNRERVFMVSILDTRANYQFPEPFPLETRLKDVLEEDVDESYYLSEEKVQKILEHCDRKVSEGCGFRPQTFKVEDINFDRPLQISFDYVAPSGMGTPYFKIKLSRQCYVRELVAEVLKRIETPVNSIHFSNDYGGIPFLSFATMNEALQSTSVIIDLDGVIDYGWMSPSPEWRISGLHIVNP